MRANIIDKIVYIIPVVIVLTFITYLVISNTIPFNLNKDVSISNGDVNSFTPVDRIFLDNGVYTQVGDIAYFTINMPLSYEKIDLKIVYKFKRSDQVASVGFRDQERWHYNLKNTSEGITDNLSDGWHSTVLHYDLRSAFIVRNKLSWIILANDLKETGSSIQISDIQANMKINGWLR